MRTGPARVLLTSALIAACNAQAPAPKLVAPVPATPSPLTTNSVESFRADAYADAETIDDSDRISDPPGANAYSALTFQWATYFDAADSAAMSRLFMGIHIPTDDFTGRVIGAQVGRAAWSLAAKYFDGSATTQQT